MAYQLIYVDDASPGACGDAGVVYSGGNTLTTSNTIAGAAMTLSSTLAVTGNVAVNTNKFTVAAATGNTVIAGTLTQTGAVAAAGSITLGAGADLIGSGTSDITINTDKFTVAGATGNTVIAGTLTQTGAVAAAASITLGAGADLIGSGTSDITINTDKFTVAGATGNTVIAGTCTITGALTQTGAVGCAASITLGAGADLIGSATSDITINTDKFTVAGATGNTVIAGTASVAGVLTCTEAVGFGATKVAAAHGAYAIPVDEMVTNVSTDADSDLACTLADGEDGQLKVVVFDTDGGSDVVITPAHFGNGSTLTMDTASDYAVFAFDGTEWWVVSHNGTIA